MNFTFSKSKKNLFIIIVLSIFLSISLPHGLRGYPLSILFLFWAYINKSKKTTLFAGGTSKDKIKNW